MFVANSAEELVRPVEEYPSSKSRQNGWCVVLCACVCACTFVLVFTPGLFYVAMAVAYAGDDWTNKIEETLADFDREGRASVGISDLAG